MPPISFLSTPNGPIVIVHVEPPQLVDERRAARERARISRLLGDLPVIMRCSLGGHSLLSGDEHLHHYAISAEADTLPRLIVAPLSVPQPG